MQDSVARAAGSDLLGVADPRLRFAAPGAITLSASFAGSLKLRISDALGFTRADFNHKP